MNKYVNIKRVLGTEEDQVKLESDMAQEGRDSYIKSTLRAVERGEEGNTAYGNRLVSGMTDELAAAITEWVEAPRKGPGRHHKALPYLKMLDARTAAYITLRMLVDSISKMTLMSATAIKIAEALSLEVAMRNMSQEDKILHKGILTCANKRSQYHRKQYTATYMAEQHGTALHEWDKDINTSVGTVLIELCVSKLGIIEVALELGKNKQEYTIKPTEACLEWIRKCNAKHLDIATIYQPMVVQPFPWQDPFTGGYLTNNVRPLTFVKTVNKTFLEKLETVEMPGVYEAVNKAQSTAWRINSEILDLLDNLIETESELGKLPPAKDKKPREVPEDFDTNEEAKKKWKAHASKVYKDNRSNKSKRLTLLSILQTAKKYACYEKIYFPHQLCFRGRVYSATNGSLSPQGPDYVKALLQFAEGEKLGTQEAADWLAVHVANVWAIDKIDKESFAARIAWTKANTEMLCRVAENPYDFRQWTDADKPFQAVVAAMEWKGYIENGLDHVSRIPVALDGSCSGLQHLGMALRCKETGKEVNLMPAEKPQDIYQTVIDKVLPELINIVGPGWEDLDYPGIIKHAENAMEEIYNKNKSKFRIKKPFAEWKEIAKKEKKKKDGTLAKRIAPEQEAYETYHRIIAAFAWLNFGYDKKTGKLSRKLAKNAVMTFAYGSEQYGFTEQLKVRVIKKAMDEGGSNETFDGIIAPVYSLIWDEGKYKALSASLLAKLLYKAVTGTVVKAAEGMKWLQEAAKVAAENGKPLHWQTPLGFLVEQNYWKTEDKRTQTSFLGGEKVRFRIQVETSECDKEKQASAIAPNFVHSLDATHLMMVVNKSEFKNFALIHDSFGTLPSQTQKLYENIKETFYKLYTAKDHFEDLKEQLTKRVKDVEGAHLPMTPIKGNLDPQEILNSPYCFG
ncbi:hypothetical protein H0A36_20085 [Endozoicomonas sp. SM1973]|uniref:DNA-directed RNA polymerase n=1 Tax=Spartinivicinus marinus TaxID=2994442 RepID=A0A853I2Z4_9GAMM|nr:DNA-directed RNA polymerase [Spartinivicinus marinus]MCX4025657.1 hypothetical protein [Spartinivicinus marinus]NYZ68320.1 hypothetical protein [Spartinivicinus marinus]